MSPWSDFEDVPVILSHYAIKLIKLDHPEMEYHNQYRSSKFYWYLFLLLGHATARDLWQNYEEKGGECDGSHWWKKNEPFKTLVPKAGTGLMQEEKKKGGGGGGEWSHERG